MNENLFIATLQQNNICRYMTAISKYFCIYKLDIIVNKYNNTYHTAIKMKPANINFATYTDVLTLLWNIMIKILNVKFAFI